MLNNGLKQNDELQSVSCGTIKPKLSVVFSEIFNICY